MSKFQGLPNPIPVPQAEGKVHQGGLQLSFLVYPPLAVALQENLGFL